MKARARMALYFKQLPHQGCTIIVKRAASDEGAIFRGVMRCRSKTLGHPVIVDVWETTSARSAVELARSRARLPRDVVNADTAAAERWRMSATHKAARGR